MENKDLTNNEVVVEETVQQQAETNENVSVIDSSINFEDLSDEEKEKIIADEAFESLMKEEEDKWTALEKERDEFKNKYLYAVAETDNQRKRFATERQNIINNAGAFAITKILPIVDDFERAIKANEKVDDVENLKDGFNTLYNKFMSVLSTLNVEKIDTTDAVFDTDYHEAVTTVPGDESLKDKVIDCIETGYKLNGQVIRHSKVVVGA